jgi:hypothetical protein
MSSRVTKEVLISTKAVRTRTMRFFSLPRSVATTCTDLLVDSSSGSMDAKDLHVLGRAECVLTSCEHAPKRVYSEVQRNRYTYTSLMLLQVGDLVSA